MSSDSASSTCRPRRASPGRRCRVDGAACRPAGRKLEPASRRGPAAGPARPATHCPHPRLRTSACPPLPHSSPTWRIICLSSLGKRDRSKADRISRYRSTSGKSPARAGRRGRGGPRVRVRATRTLRGWPPLAALRTAHSQLRPAQGIASGCACIRAARAALGQLAGAQPITCCPLGQRAPAAIPPPFPHQHPHTPGCRWNSRCTCANSCMAGKGDGDSGSEMPWWVHRQTSCVQAGCGCAAGPERVGAGAGRLLRCARRPVPTNQPAHCTRLSNLWAAARAPLCLWQAHAAQRPRRAALLACARLSSSLSCAFFCPK